MSACQSFLARLFKVLATNLTSRKFWITVGVLWYERADHWANVACIYTFDKPDQLTAFTAQVGQHRWFVGTVLLAFIGIQTALNFSSNATNALSNIVQNAASYTKTESKHTEVIIDENAKNQNLRADKEEA